MKYKSVNKPDKCPECGSDKIAGIMFGLPIFSDDLRKRLRNSEIVPEGCCVTDEDPSWKCADCNTLIFKMEIDLKELTN